MRHFGGFRMRDERELPDATVPESISARGTTGHGIEAGKPPRGVAPSGRQEEPAQAGFGPVGGSPALDDVSGHQPQTTASTPTVVPERHAAVGG